jgi:hypothetical protein
MLYRSLLAALALTAAATDSEAGPFRRSRTSYQPVYQPACQSPVFLPSQPTYQAAYPSPTITSSGVVTAGGVVVGNPAPSPVVEHVSGYTPAAAASVATAGVVPGDALDEVNAKRMSRGLRPFLRDEGLTQGARACAAFRANHGLFGHTSNDFAFLPAGTYAVSGGCAAYPANFGWMSCCVYENYTYAGAAYVTGRDGRRYMHLFVR